MSCSPAQGGKTSRTWPGPRRSCCRHAGLAAALTPRPRAPGTCTKTNSSRHSRACLGLGPQQCPRAGLLSGKLPSGQGAGPGWSGHSRASGGRDSERDRLSAGWSGKASADIQTETRGRRHLKQRHSRQRGGERSWSGCFGELKGHYSWRVVGADAVRGPT